MTPKGVFFVGGWGRLSFFRGLGTFFARKGIGLEFRRFRRFPQTFALPISSATTFSGFIWDEHRHGLALRQCSGSAADNLGVNPGSHHVRNQLRYVGQVRRPALLKTS